MTDLQIRSIRQEDFDDVMRIQEAILQRKVPPTGVNLVKLHLSKPDGISLVAERNGEVIGFLFGEIKHGDFGLEKSGWIEMFGVSPKAMGQGGRQNPGPVRHGLVPEKRGQGHLYGRALGLRRSLGLFQKNRFQLKQLYQSQEQVGLIEQLLAGTEHSKLRPGKAWTVSPAETGSEDLPRGQVLQDPTPVLIHRTDQTNSIDKKHHSDIL